VPVVLALDLDCREAGRQRAARHHVLWLDDLLRRVEIDQIAAPHVDGTETDTRIGVVRVHPIEIDEALERRLELHRVVVARRLDCAGWMKPWVRDPRSEEPRGPTDKSHGGAHLIEETARVVPPC